MAAVISDESIWAVVALVFLRIELGSNWTGNAIFTVPERQVWWAVAGLVLFVPDLLISLLISWAFANVISGELSWEFTWHLAVALLGCVVVHVISWAGSASLVNWVEDVWSCALNTVVGDFNEALWAASLDFVIIPRWVRGGEGFSGLSWGKQDEEGEKSEFSNKICHLIKRIN